MQNEELKQEDVIKEEVKIEKTEKDKNNRIKEAKIKLEHYKNFLKTEFNFLDLENKFLKAKIDNHFLTQKYNEIFKPKSTIEPIVEKMEEDKEEPSVKNMNGETI